MTHPALSLFAQETEPDRGDLARLEARVAASLPNPAAAGVLLPLMPGPTSQMLASMRARVGGITPRHRPEPSAAFAVIAVAALLLLVVFQRPSRQAPEPIAVELQAPSQWSEAQPVEALSLRFRGNGTVSGDSEAPRIDWRWGELDVDVDPTAGLAVTVQTDEATIRVLGTAFLVDRSPLGTDVVVARGEVAVECAGSETVIGVNEQRTCLPLSSEGRLGRARALHDRDGASRALLEEVESIGADPSDAAGYELLALRIEILSQLEDYDDALDAAEALAAQHGPRREELLHVTAGLAYALHGCSRASPHLSSLLREGVATPEEQRLLTFCLENP